MIIIIVSMKYMKFVFSMSIKILKCPEQEKKSDEFPGFGNSN